MGEKADDLPLPVAGEVPALEIRERLFPHHMKDFARINHGSYGSAPLPVLQAQESIRMQCLAQPDLFLNKQLEGLMLEARQEVASEVGCRDVNNIVLLDNVTTAAAVVAALVADNIRAGAATRWPEGTGAPLALATDGSAAVAAYGRPRVGGHVREATWQSREELHGNPARVQQPGEVVLMSAHSYDAVRKSFEHYILPAGGDIETVPLPFPHPTPEAIVRSFLEAAEGVARGGRRVALAVVDHVSSMPSFILPVTDLVAGLHASGVPWVFIDGAHSVGSVDVDVESLGADFYSSNLHKWAFAPLSAAFLYCKHAALVAPRAGHGCPVGTPQVRLHHPVVSHGYDTGLAGECFYTGTRDYSAILAAPAGLRVGRALGGGSLRGVWEHNHKRVIAMARMLAAAWDTSASVPEEMCASMAMVALPSRLRMRSQGEADAIRDRLREEFSVEAPILYVKAHLHIPGPVLDAQDEGTSEHCSGHVRISHQVYNCESDYATLRDAVLALCKAVEGS